MALKLAVDNTTRTLAELDAAGITVWRNQSGWRWAYELDLKEIQTTLDLTRVPVHGPFPSCVAAGSHALEYHHAQKDAQP